MYKIDRRGGGGGLGVVQKSYTRKLPCILLKFAFQGQNLESRQRSLELTIVSTFPYFTQCQILTPKEINKGKKQTTITSFIFLSFF